MAALLVLVAIFGLAGFICLSLMAIIYLAARLTWHHDLPGLPADTVRTVCIALSAVGTVAFLAASILLLAVSIGAVWTKP